RAEDDENRAVQPAGAPRGPDGEVLEAVVVEVADVGDAGPGLLAGGRRAEIHAEGDGGDDRVGRGRGSPQVDGQEELGFQPLAQRGKSRGAAVTPPRVQVPRPAIAEEHWRLPPPKPKVAVRPRTPSDSALRWRASLGRPSRGGHCGASHANRSGATPPP